MYESINGIGPTNNVIKFTRVSEIHCRNTRHAGQGNLYNVLELPDLALKVSKFWVLNCGLPFLGILNSQTKKSFNSCFKKYKIPCARKINDMARVSALLDRWFESMGKSL